MISRKFPHKCPLNDPYSLQQSIHHIRVDQIYFSITFATLMIKTKVQPYFSLCLLYKLSSYVFNLHEVSRFGEVTASGTLYGVIQLKVY